MVRNKTVLIVEDNVINLKLLTKILEEHYNVLKSKNGEEAIELLRTNINSVSAILLDLNMPVMDGYEFLEWQMKDEILSAIPTIVLTSTNKEEAKIKSLELGASDFITKPYNPAVVSNKLKNFIKLKETSIKLNNLQLDELTGLFNKYAFFENINESTFDREEYLVVAVNIVSFKLINDLLGMETADNLLIFLGLNINNFVVNNEGIGSRFNADKQDFMDFINDKVSNFIDDFEINIKYGITTFNQDSDISVLSNQAVLALSQIKNIYQKNYAYYKDSILKEIQEKQNINNEFDRAIKEDQFIVYYQPKYSLSSNKIVGFEALVRWDHPIKGILKPDYFIPVYESNGKITRLDHYVWKKACNYIKEIEENIGYSIPVSVNVSQLNLYYSNFVEYLLDLVENYDIKPELLHLEITETAYMTNEKQILDVVTRLRNEGFIFEMDDIGSGYSSLNALCELAVDILKLDMRFLNSDNKLNIVKFVLDLAKSLNLQVVAEGIETKEMNDFLRDNNCDMGQGYYFSKPGPKDQIIEKLKRINC